MQKKNAVYGVEYDVRQQQIVLYFVFGHEPPEQTTKKTKRQTELANSFHRKDFPHKSH